MRTILIMTCLLFNASEADLHKVETNRSIEFTEELKGTSVQVLNEKNENRDFLI